MSLQIAMVTKESISRSFETTLGGASGSNGAFSMRCSPRPIRRKALRYAHDLYRGANPQGNVDLLYSALRTVSALVIEHGATRNRQSARGFSTRPKIKANRSYAENGHSSGIGDGGVRLHRRTLHPALCVVSI
jgi:hypothetical protein